MTYKEIMEALEIGLENTLEAKVEATYEWHTDHDIDRIHARYDGEAAKIKKCIDDLKDKAYSSIFCE